MVQRLPHLLQTGPLGHQRDHHAAERAVHCQETRAGVRLQHGTPAPALLPPGPPVGLSPPSPIPPFWARTQKLLCSWLYSGGRLKGSWLWDGSR